MAGETTLGKLIVRLLMDKQDFEEKTKGAQKDIERLGERFDSLGDAINSTVVGAFKAATAAIAAFGAATTVIGANFENAITKVGAIAGASAEEMEQLTAQARKIGAATAFTATQAAGAMTELAQAGMRTADIISASEAAVLLAGATGASMEQSTGLIAATLSQFQLGATETARVADVFSKAMRTTLFDMNSLTEAMKYAGTTGAGFGYTLEETTAAVAMFRNLGLEGSLAGTAFKMALASAAQQTDINAEVLAKYNLTLADVNPSLRSFADIMETVGKAGMTTADAMTVFGTRAGASVAQIARTFASGATNYYEVLNGLETSTGQTAEMYATMMDTVVGQFKIAVSAFEELMLTVFDTYGGPLKELLTEVGNTLMFVGAQVGTHSATMRDGLGGAIQQVTEWVRDNRANFVIWFQAVADSVSRLIKLFVALAPYIDEIATGIALIFVAQKVYAFVVAIQSAIVAVKALAAAISSAAAAGTILSGGLLPVAAAVLAAVAALVALATASNEAEEAAQRLAEAEGKVRAEVDAATQAYEAQTATVLAAQQERIRAYIDEKKATGELTAEELARLQGFLKLTAAEAAAKKMAGQLVEVNGELVDVQTLIEERGNEGIRLVEEQAAAFLRNARAEESQRDRMTEALESYLQVTRDGMSETAAFSSTLALYGATVEEVEQRIASASKESQKWRAAQKALLDESMNAQARIYQQNDAEARRQAQREMDRNKAVTQEMIDKREKAAERTREIEARLASELAAIGANRVKQVEIELANKLRLINKAYDDELKLYSKGSAKAREIEARRAASIEQVRAASAAKIADETNTGLDKERDALRTLYMDEAAMAADATDQRIAELNEVFVVEMSLYEQGSAEYRAAEERRQQALALVRDLFLAQQEQREQVAAQERADAIASMEADNARSRMTMLESIEADRLAAIRDMHGATAADIARINAVYDDRIAEAKQALSDRVQDILVSDEKESIRLEREKHKTLESLAGASAAEIAAVSAQYDKKIRDARVKEGKEGFAKVTDAGKKAAAAIADAFTIVGDALSSVASFAMDVFGELTGFAFDLGDAVSELVSAQETAKEEGTVFDAADAAEELVAGLVEGAVAMVQMFVAAAPTLVRSLAEQLPSLVTEIAAALPGLVQELAAQMPVLVQGLVDAIGPVIDAVIESIPFVVQAIVTSLPILIDGVLSALPRLIEAILAAVPTLIEALAAGIVQIVQGLPALLQPILDALPGIITSLLGAIPQIIEALVAAIPIIVGQVIDALPSIIIALVNGILGIVVSLAEQLPILIAAIIELIPDLIGAIVGMIPTLITSIIGAIPDIIFGLIAGLPDIISGLIRLIPDLIVQIISALPDIIVALVEGLIFELIPMLPQIAIELVASIFEGIWDGLKDLAEAFVDWIKEALGIGGKDEEKSAYSGIDYVPATMRVTVHPGEAIVPASRNPAASPRSAANFSPVAPPMRGGAGGMRLDLAVMMDGRVIDAVTISALDNGHAPKLERRLQKVSGVVKGYNRGKYTP